MNTRLILSLPIWIACRFSTAATCPAISPAVRLRLIPSFAVRQNWQFTAHPTWLEMQIVARLYPFSANVPKLDFARPFPRRSQYPAFGPATAQGDFVDDYKNLTLKAV